MERYNKQLMIRYLWRKSDRLIRSKTATYSDKIVFQRICRILMNAIKLHKPFEKLFVYAGNAALAKSIGRNELTVSRAISALEKRGLLSVSLEKYKNGEGKIKTKRKIRVLPLDILIKKIGFGLLRPDRYKKPIKFLSNKEAARVVQNLKNYIMDDKNLHHARNPELDVDVKYNYKFNNKYNYNNERGFEPLLSSPKDEKFNRGDFIPLKDGAMNNVNNSKESLDVIKNKKKRVNNKWLMKIEEELERKPEEFKKVFTEYIDVMKSTYSGNDRNHEKYCFLVNWFSDNNISDKDAVDAMNAVLLEHRRYASINLYMKNNYKFAILNFLKNRDKQKEFDDKGKIQEKKPEVEKKVAENSAETYFNIGDIVEREYTLEEKRVLFKKIVGRMIKFYHDRNRYPESNHWVRVDLDINARKYDSWLETQSADDLRVFVRKELYTLK